MTEYLNKFKVYFDKLKITKSSYKKKGIIPGNDWRNLLTITFIIICLISIYAFYFYLQVRDEKIFITENTDTNNGVNLNKPVLDKVVNEINNRSIELLKLQNNRTTIGDPSL